MAYEAKTNWKLDDTVMPEDMNRIEQGIQDLGLELGNVAVHVITASEENIVDFNALVETGIHIIKNATTSTTTNAPALGSSGDAIIEVGKRDNIIFQSVMTITNNGIPYHRQNSGGTWSSWLSTIATSVIRVGTLNSGMACNTPTANTHLANKGYVDTQIEEKINENRNLPASSITAGTFAGQVNANTTATATLGTAQVRNISASTADLTAGTSALATGDIYFVYE